MPENDGRHHDNSITVPKEQGSQERGNGDADAQKKEKKKNRSLQRQRRPDEEEKKGRKIQEKHDGTGENGGQEVWKNPPPPQKKVKFLPMSGRRGGELRRGAGRRRFRGADWTPGKDQAEAPNKGRCVFIIRLKDTHKASM